MASFMARLITGSRMVAANLSARGLRAAAYHAGLPNTDRSQLEHRFHEDELDVVVATIAFGMGIDKPDVRWVFHADVSGSLDEYYQEFGRAGRDGGLPTRRCISAPRTWLCHAGTRRARDQAERLSRPWRPRWHRIRAP